MTIKVIFWDFDGVIMDSNAIRDQGFAKVLKDFPSHEIDQLLAFHQKNGGLSRYVKFRYFFEEIRGESISDEEVDTWAKKFSVYMFQSLVNPDLLIFETLSFVKRSQGKFIMHIVSGSDQDELREICKRLEIDVLFHSINGSPTPKTQLLKDLLALHQYRPEECLMIGDSINDFNAADDNKIEFMEYGNPKISHHTSKKIELNKV